MDQWFFIIILDESIIMVVIINCFIIIVMIEPIIIITFKQLMMPIGGWICSFFKIVATLITKITIATK